MKSRKLQRLVLRAILISTLVCTVNINIIANKGTFSMFTSSAEGYATIETADTGDLIGDFNIVEEEGQQFIVIEPGEFLKDNSTLYFEVTGDAEPYILHVNPVTILKDKTPMNDNYIRWNYRSRKLYVSKNQQYFVSDDGKIYIPIYVDVNIWQKPSVLSNEKYTGNITLRYLNGFINETKEVDLSSDYLNSRWHCGTDYYFWENAKSILSKNALAVNKFENEFQNKFQNEFKKLFNGTLDNEQIEVIDSIAYGYRDYVNNIETKNQELLKQLEDLQKQNLELINQIEALKRENVQLSESLSSQLEALRMENEQLQAAISQIRQNTGGNNGGTTNPGVSNGTGSEVTNPGVSNGTGSEVTNPGVSNGTGSEVTNPGVSNGTGSEVTNPGVSNGTENEVTDPGVSNGTGNEVTDPGVSNGTGNEVTDPGISNGTGNEVTDPGVSNGYNSETGNQPTDYDTNIIGYQYNYTILRGLNEINNTNNMQITLSLIQNNFNDV